MQRRSESSFGVVRSRTSVALLLAIVVLLALRRGFLEFGDKLEDTVRGQLEQQHERTATPTAPDTKEEEPMVGAGILAGYADADTLPEEDLIRLAHSLNNFASLLGADHPPPHGSNEELAAALRGKNRAQVRFLPDTHPLFNAQGQIVDRWDTPLFFHAISRDRLDMRSAGPDRILWTEDDLHRTHDGRFLRGEELNRARLPGGESGKGK